MPLLTELWNILVAGFYKYAAPLALENRIQLPASLFPKPSRKMIAAVTTSETDK